MRLKYEHCNSRQLIGLNLNAIIDATMKITEWCQTHRWIGRWAPISQGIKNKNLKAGVVKNKNIYFKCLAFFSVENFKKSHLVAEPAFSFRAVFW